MSTSPKSLKEQVRAFIDRIADDLALIETQENKEEILVEYKRTLNCSAAITEVVARHKAIEDEKARQTEAEARRRTAQQNIEMVDAATPGPVILDAPTTTPTPDPEADREYVVVFKVTATREKLRALKQFLIGGGYKYVS